MPPVFLWRADVVVRLAVLTLSVAACQKADDAAMRAGDSPRGGDRAAAAPGVQSPDLATPPGKGDAQRSPGATGAGGKAPLAEQPRARSSPSGGVRPPSRETAAAAPRRVTLGNIDLTGVGHDRGDPAAPVVVIDFSDFGCPYCSEFSLKTYPSLEEEYVRTGKVFFKYVPFIIGSFPNAREATRAAECAADQDRFWPMLDRVYGAQREWKQARDPVPILTALAAAEGLDVARFGVCYRSGRTDARTERATRAADEVGVRVTPSFVVNGHPVQGALPLAEFRKVISGALMLLESER